MYLEDKKGKVFENTAAALQRKSFHGNAIGGKIFRMGLQPLCVEKKERRRGTTTKKKVMGFFPLRENSGTFENIGTKLC